MRSPSQGTPARRGSRAQLLPGRTAPRRLAPRRRDQERCEEPQPLLSARRRQGSAQASKPCAQLLSTRAACPDPRRIREAHRSAPPAVLEMRSVRATAVATYCAEWSSTSHTSPTPASCLAPGRGPICQGRSKITHPRRLRIHSLAGWGRLRSRARWAKRSGRRRSVVGRRRGEVLVAEPVAVALQRQDLGVVDEPVDHRSRGRT